MEFFAFSKLEVVNTLNTRCVDHYTSESVGYTTFYNSQHLGGRYIIQYRYFTLNYMMQLMKRKVVGRNFYQNNRYFPLIFTVPLFLFCIFNFMQDCIEQSGS